MSHRRLGANSTPTGPIRLKTSLQQSFSFCVPSLLRTSRIVVHIWPIYLHSRLPPTAAIMASPGTPVESHARTSLADKKFPTNSTKRSIAERLRSPALQRVMSPFRTSRSTKTAYRYSPLGQRNHEFRLLTLLPGVFCFRNSGRS
jgi:hypothetical protein